MLRLIKEHKCSIYCIPKENIHADIALTPARSTQEDVLLDSTYLKGYEKGDILSIREVTEYDIHKLREDFKNLKPLDVINGSHTKPWLVILRGIIEEC